MSCIGTSALLDVNVVEVNLPVGFRPRYPANQVKVAPALLLRPQGLNEPPRTRASGDRAELGEVEGVVRKVDQGSPVLLDGATEPFRALTESKTFVAQTLVVTLDKPSSDLAYLGDDNVPRGNLSPTRSGYRRRCGPPRATRPPAHAHGGPPGGPPCPGPGVGPAAGWSVARWVDWVGGGGQDPPKASGCRSRSGVGARWPSLRPMWRIGGRRPVSLRPLLRRSPPNG